MEKIFKNFSYSSSKFNAIVVKRSRLWLDANLRASQGDDDMGFKVAGNQRHIGATISYPTHCFTG